MPGSSPGMTILTGPKFMRHLLFGTLVWSLASGIAAAQDRPTGFMTPSKNIVCQFYTIDARDTLRCDIMAMDTRPKRPASCDLEWGDAFEMTTRSSAARPCHGDTMMDRSLPVLGYGETWQRGSFTCRSEQTGLTCFNAMRHGFSLSRAKQEVF